MIRAIATGLARADARACGYAGAHVRAGLTLLELLIAMVLMAFVLGATWTLMGVFRDRLETSQQQTERWQLIRSLQQVLSDDLRSCQLPVTPEPAEDRSQQGQPITSPTSDAGAPSLDNETDQAINADAAAFSPIGGPWGAEAGTNRAGTSTGADLIVRSQWLDPESVLLGTSTALMFDIIPPPAHQQPLPLASPQPLSDQRPLEQPQQQPLDLEPSLEQALIPDTLRRVVYVFHDRDTATRLDQPPGLIRCELTMRQLTFLRELGSSGLDLVTLLQDELPAWQIAYDNSSVRPADWQTSSHPLDAQAGHGAAPGDRPGLTGLSTIGGIDLELRRYLDYVPEVATFLLRYYDGSTWRTQWDSRQSGQLPVAIELRFQLVNELPADDVELDGVLAEQSGSDDLGAGNVSQRLGSSPAPLEPMDDRLRSAQTRPPDDHRFLIFLHSPSNRNREDIGDSPTDSAFGTSSFDRSAAEVPQ